jgi:hypothetical protein
VGAAEGEEDGDVAFRTALVNVKLSEGGDVGVGGADTK